MKFRLFAYFSVLILCMIASPTICQAFEIEIDISPSTLNLAYQGQVVTVHTNIDYSDVIGASVMLDEIEISWWKSDDCGDFVAKFNVDDVKEYLRGKEGNVTLTLSGTTKDGEAFSGADSIRIVNISAKK